jgi:hypothetical protein
MHLPKQTLPVIRVLSSASYSSRFGVSPSIGQTFFRRLFNRCSCNVKNTNTGTVVSPDGRGNCSAGYVPRCSQSGDCTCVERREAFRNSNGLLRSVVACDPMCGLARNLESCASQCGTNNQICIVSCVDQAIAGTSKQGCLNNCLELRQRVF